jgi:hypothetical protein
MSHDGCSTITFFDRIKEYEQTILVIKDSKGWVFGCFCQEPWRVAFQFFGDGDNTLFSYADTEEPTLYYWTGCGDQFMYSD